MDVPGIDAWLDLPAFRVTDHVIWSHELELHLERRDTSLVCPRCQGCCERIQDGRDRCIRDFPLFERPGTLRVHLRRLPCSPCPPRPWEKSETFGDPVKWTERLSHQVRQGFLHGGPCQELARRYGLSARTVFCWTFEKSRGGRPRQRGRALGMDAYSRRTGHRSNTIIVDVDKGRPITTLKGRRVEDVGAWFQSRLQADLDGGEGVVLDMSKSFDSASTQVLGDHVEGIDRFHGVQQAVGALDGGLRSVHKQLNHEEAKALKKLRKRWLKVPNQLEIDELIARADWRRRFPELREVIDWVQDLRQWFERTYDKPARAALGKLIERARASAWAPLQDVGGT